MKLDVCVSYHCIANQPENFVAQNNTHALCSWICFVGRIHRWSTLCSPAGASPLGAGGAMSKMAHTYGW